MVCHCNECKRLGGSVFAVHYPVAPGAFKLTSGEPKTHSFKHRAGIGITAAFCGDCGSWLYKQAEADPWHGFFLVEAGTTDVEPGQEAQGYWTNPPAVELWVSERAPWLGSVQGADQRAQF